MSTLYKQSTTKNTNRIPLCIPEMHGNEWTYLKECIDTNYVSSVGPFVERFERGVADYVGAKYAVATVNGTAALHVALLVAGIQPDDEVLVSTLTFIAPVNAIRYAGAWPVFMDADPAYWQMDPEKTSDFLEKQCLWTKGQLRNKKTGRKVRAILPVHLLGHPVNIDPIIEIAKKYDLVVIEDATEGLGAKYKEQMIGRLGDLACFSFNGNKIITTGGGGMIVTDNEAWANKARYLTTQAKDDPVEYIHNEIGFNYRLTNIQAALGCAQLENLSEYIVAKQRIASVYKESLKDVGGLTPMCEAPWARSIWWMFTVLVDGESYGIDSRMLLKTLSASKIESRPLWQPIHRSRPYSDCQTYFCETADRLYRDALSLPCSVGITPEQIDAVLLALKHSGRNG